jgi:hypothetical protein
MRYARPVWALTWLICLTAGLPAATQEVPRNTVVKVQLMEDLSSKDAKVGDLVRAAVAPDDESGLPPGTNLVGRVTQVQRATKSRPGVIDVRFSVAELPDRWTPISGTLYSLNDRDVERTASGRLVAKGRRNERGKFIGYGALGGVVLGSLLGTSSLEGALLGAAAGYLYGESRRDKSKYRDVQLSDGDTFGVRLDRRLVLRPDERA